jgi:EmrB/QacA subfamily drug resistance transporter
MNTKKQSAVSAFILVILSMAQFMVVLDFSIVNVALTTIQKELHFSQANLQWAITAYALTFGGLLLLGGGLSDLYGRKRVFLTGLILFSLVSFVGGIAQSQIMLIISRAVQGIGAALIMPSSMSLITSIFTQQRDRQHALSILGAVGSSGFAAGALLGGILTATLGWRWVFFVNVPIGILTAIFAYLYVPETSSRKEQVKLDLSGAFTITFGLAAFIYAVTTGGEIGFASFQVLLFGAAALILIVSFIRIEIKRKNPLVPFGVFKLPSLRAANISMLLWMGAFGTMFLLLSEYLQDVLSTSVFITGLMFLPMGLAMFVMASYFSSKLMDRFGIKPIIVTGLILASVGFLLLTYVPVHGSYWLNVFPGMTIVALGAGTSFVGLLIASVAGVSKDKQGLASGLINTSRQIGASIGIAVLVAIADAQSHALHTSTQAAFTNGIHFAFLGGLILVTCSALASVLFIKEKECGSVVTKLITPQQAADKIMCLQ